MTGSLWIRRPKAVVPGRVRLFCFPYAGAGNSVFNGWENNLRHDLEVWQVLLPGRGVRMSDPPIENISEMVDGLLEGLGPHLHAPFAFFGHSMGAVLAYQLALRLQLSDRRGLCLLAVSGRQAPHIESQFSYSRDIGDEEFIKLLGELSTETTQLLTDRSLRKVLLPLLRADFNLCESLSTVAIRPLNVPILAFAGEHDPSVTVSTVEAWRAHTNAEFTFVVLPGDHFLVRPFARELCTAIERVLLQKTRADCAGRLKES